VSLQRALTSAGLPYPHADRLVTLIAGSKSWSGPMLDEVATSSTAFDALAAIQERSAVVGAAESAEIVRLESVSSGYFDLLGVTPAQGRFFGVDDDRRDQPGAGAVISHALWQRRLDASDAAIGRAIDVDGRRLVIIGITPAGFRGLIGRTDVWIPPGTARWLSGETTPERPWSRGFEVFGRIRSELSPAQAQARYEVEGLAAIQRTGAADRILGASGRLRLIPLADARIPPVVTATTRILLWAAVAVLVFVTITLSGVAWLGAERRVHELAIRAALGATRARILALAGREAAIVAVGAAMGAILLRPLFLAALLSIRPPSLAFGIVTAELFPGGVPTIDATAIAVIAMGALMGSLPILLAVVARSRSIGIGVAPRSGAIESGLRGRPGTLTLVAVQAAIACAVLSGALLVTRATGRLFDADRGYDWRGVTTARVELPDAGYDDVAAARFAEGLASKLQARPGIAQASVSNCAPGAGRCRQSNIMRIDGRALDHPDQPTTGLNFVTPDHFAVLGIRATRGRLFTDADRPGAPLAVVITDTLAARLWPGADPIGHRLEIYTANGALAGDRTVVGTVPAIRFGVDADAGSDLFLPAAQAAWTTAVVFVKSALAGRVVGDAIVAAAAEVDRGVVIHDVASLEDRLGRSLGAELFVLRVLTAFGIAGLLLAAIGAYAISSSAVARSQRELGVRIALGATPAAIRALAGRRGAVFAVAGATVGLAAAMVAGDVLSAVLHGLSPRDPFALVAAPVATMCGVMIAVAVPAWRASHVDPIAAIRDAR
jgi:predicted permease